MKPRGLAIWIAAVLIGAAGYGFYWHYVAGRLQAGIADWAVQQRAMGHEIAFANDPISGFPLAFRTQFRAVTLTWLQPGDALSVRAETVLAEMRPWNLGNITVRSDRPVTVTLQPASLPAMGADWKNTGQEYAAASVAATIDLPATPPADYHQPLIGFDVSIEALRLPPGQRAVTAGPVVKIAARGAVMGPVPASTNLHDAIAGWAGAGGTIELKNFDFAQAPLTLAGEGTVTLDTALQPLGALTIRARGLPETIALLERDGIIDTRAARTGGMMAKGLAKPDAAGQQMVSVSLSLQQGYLWLGPVKLAPLPVLDW